MLWEHCSKTKDNVNSFIKIFSNKIERGYQKIIQISKTEKD